MNIEISAGIMGAERRFFEQLFENLERCNLTPVSLSNPKSFSVDISTIFYDTPFNVQIEIKEAEVVLYYGKGLFVKEVSFMDPKNLEAFNQFFDSMRDRDFDDRIYYLAENFSE